MDEGLSIKRHYFDENDTHKGMMYALQRTGGNDCIDDCARTDPQKLRAIARTAKRIYDRGCSFGFASETIKQIKAGRSSVQVFEVRVKGTVIRVAAHIHENWIPIYFFVFDTHQGSGNNLPKHHIDRAVSMAQAAAECAKDYDFSEYGGAR